MNGSDLPVALISADIVRPKPESGLVWCLSTGRS